MTQVALVTALDGTSHRVEGLDCGADDYVTKPVRREEFLAKLRSMLRARSLLVEVEQARATLAERNARGWKSWKRSRKPWPRPWFTI